MTLNSKPRVTAPANLLDGVGCCVSRQLRREIVLEWGWAEKIICLHLTVLEIVKFSVLKCNVQGSFSP